MESEALMDYNWCHGPLCHKRHTTNRIRGVKGSKVLRTMKLALNGYRDNSTYKIWKYFCDQTCMHDFIHTHLEEMVRLHPRPDALETPIEVEVVQREDWRGNPYTTKEIKRLTTD